MQKHLEFQVVTPRTLAEFHGPTLILPDVRVIGEQEKASLRAYVDSGKRLVITGEDATKFGTSQNVLRFNKCPGKDYYAALQKGVAEANPDQEREFLEKLKSETSLHVLASPLVATSVAQVDGKPHVFFANFAGLQGGVNPVQTPQTGIQVTVSGATKGRGFFLPFLGDMQLLQGTASGDGIIFHLPAVEKGAVFWYEP
jgi:hypothetical protein